MGIFKKLRGTLRGKKTPAAATGGANGGTATTDTPQSTQSQPPAGAARVGSDAASNDGTHTGGKNGTCCVKGATCNGGNVAAADVVEAKATVKDVPVYDALDLVFNIYVEPAVEHDGKDGAGTSEAVRMGDVMDIDGVVQLCDDLAVDPTDVVVIVIAWYMQAARMGFFHRQEFRRGMAALECATVAQLAARIPSMRADLEDDEKFRKIYKFVFAFTTEGEENGKPRIDPETGIGLWEILFNAGPPCIRQNKLVPAFLEYMKEEQTATIRKDLWLMTIEFLETVDASLESYDETEAWPTVIDEFVSAYLESQADKEEGDDH